MPYEVQTWADKNPSFPLSAARMNHIEAGIAAASAASVNVKEFGVTGNGATDDSTHFQEALNAGKESAVFVPSSGAGYLCKSELTVPAATTVEGMDKWRAIIRTDSKTLFLFKLEGQNDIERLRFEAKNTQTAGGAVDLSSGGYSKLEDLTFGSNFFIGLNIAGVSKPGAITGARLTWAESGAGVTGTGTAIKVGDGEHLSVAINLDQVYILGKEVSGVKQAIEWNYCDSCTLDHTLIQTVGKGLNTGNLGKEPITGLKIAHVIVDTCSAPCYDLALVQDMSILGCNGQGGNQGLVLRGEGAAHLGGVPASGVRIEDSQFQVNVGEGIVGESTTQQIIIANNSVISNNTSGTAGLAGIHMIQGAHDWQITGNRVSNAVLAGGAVGKQKKGIYIEAGTTAGGADKYVITNNVCTTDAEQTIGVDDKGAGTHKEVEHNATF